MAESESHRRLKRKAAGKSGRTEVPIKGNRRIDAVTKKKAVEIEKSGNFEDAAKRLKDSRKPQKVMRVPDTERKSAAAAMRQAGVGGSVTNLGGKKRISVPKRKK